MQKGCACPLHRCFPSSFNLSSEIIVIIIILNNTNDNRAARPRSTCGSPVLQPREMGQDRGLSPSLEGQTFPRLLPTRVTAGEPREWELGSVPGQHGGISPLVPPPCPASRGCSLSEAPPASCQQNGWAPAMCVKKKPCRADLSRDR